MASVIFTRTSGRKESTRNHRRVKDGIPLTQSREKSAQENFRKDLNNIYFKELTQVPEGATDFENKYDLEWENPMAIQRVYEMERLFGQEPDALDRKRGGFARFAYPPANAVDGRYEYLHVNDEGFLHNKPEPHIDFLFLGIYLPLKQKTRMEIPNLTGSAYYYPIGEILVAGCDFIEASLGTFSVIKELDEGHISLEKARELYNHRIAQLKEEHLEAEANGGPREYETPLRDAVEQYLFNE